MQNTQMNHDILTVRTANYEFCRAAMNLEHETLDPNTTQRTDAIQLADGERISIADRDP